MLVGWKAFFTICVRERVGCPSRWINRSGPLRLAPPLTCRARSNATEPGVIPLSATALRRGHDRGIEPIKINETNGTFPHILICMMVKVPAVLIVTKSYLTDLANLLQASGTLHVLAL